ncbi:TetR/AcrR family transcriptional regulator [Ornithinibacillus halotolerans]|uniref:TetR family transcriptional regulator n=1 Tax=Ornithinibacillus halotolerans TaxID=1274357 RepID=A0A916S2V0_9BACI|nr:TetR/AcrR family transcriptional regulator [Ornithinibacillus halotolerans]GGA81228.1 TetR family transcriptional regulator [Ornithinibacillus halotolerans]
MSKKQLIMEKAVELFSKQGFEATSVQQITDYCGISKGAFYLSFKSKDELILALIDYYMQQFSTELDYTVRNETKENTLYQFFYKTFHAFSNHVEFARLLMKEQTYSLNEALLDKMRYYDQLTNETILTIIEKVYGDAINDIKFDLILAIKGLLNSYSSLLLFNKVAFDEELAAESLVEKTNILATYMSTPFITEEQGKMFQHFSVEDMSKEQLLSLMSSIADDIEDSLEKDSLVLLKEQIDHTSFNLAIIKGLIENIRANKQCKWIAYLLEKHFNLL